ncbi:MAG: hypothetical protein LAO08_15100 [Acidobacteriia bacterium]|nr:hypothetical protein [Terriglobia bacterium]
MKRMTVVSLVVLLPAFCAGAGNAYAQHGHAGGTGAMGGGVGNMGGGMGNTGGSMSGAHGNAGNAVSHAMGASGNTSHGSSLAASTNPSDVLDHNTQLSTKLEGLLGLSGPTALATLKTDASGFKNFGQFMAAVHVSNNLGIPFSDLQNKMTGPNAVSLGKAIQALKPDADAKAEAKKAAKQSNEEMQETQS